MVSHGWGEKEEGACGSSLGVFFVVRPEDAKASYCEVLSGGACEAAVGVGVMVCRLAAWDKRW